MDTPLKAQSTLIIRVKSSVVSLSTNTVPGEPKSSTRLTSTCAHTSASNRQKKIYVKSTH